MPCPARRAGGCCGGASRWAELRALMWCLTEAEKLKRDAWQAGAAHRGAATGPVDALK